MNLNPYVVFDHVLVDFLEPEDLIRSDGEVYEVLDVIASTDGFIIKALDEYEEYIDVFIPDNTIIPLLEED